MKLYIILITWLICNNAFSQINLEKAYSGTVPGGSIDFRYALVDSNDMKILNYDSYAHTLFIHNLDHSLDQSIVLTIDQFEYISQLTCVTKHLFDTDDGYEFIISYSSSVKNGIKIYDENGTVLFSRDSFGLRGTYTGSDVTRMNETILNTPQGTKMILAHDFGYKYEVYSLPGKLPTNNTKLSVTDAPTIISSGGSSLSAYPNPSNGKIRVAYSLPEGVTTGELVITTTDGREVKRYRVGNMFNDILIEKSELATGAYFYKLITERGESEARKFVITN